MKLYYISILFIFHISLLDVMNEIYLYLSKFLVNILHLNILAKIKL